MYVYMVGCCDCRLRRQLAGAIPFPPPRFTVWCIIASGRGCAGHRRKNAQARAADVFSAVSRACSSACFFPVFVLPGRAVASRIRCLRSRATRLCFLNSPASADIQGQVLKCILERHGQGPLGAIPWSGNANSNAGHVHTQLQAV